MSDYQRLVEQNLGLAHACAHKMKGKGIEYEELYSAACEGLVKAAKRFDEDYGCKFSTYAVPVILGEIKRLFRDGGAVKISRSLKELALKASSEKEKFCLSRGREPTVSELAVLLGVSDEQANEAICAMQPVMSLTVDDDGKEHQNDIAVSGNEDEFIDRLSLRQALSRLPENERMLITYRYINSQTQASTAKQLGISQVQVSRKEKQILLKLRKMLA
ncbi:MAG: sigma-70 family RNA polymerase sigma factor [Clostridia bacterium]|nr:sigma-70 family RNA polymerase sigma factor [Clostridia bacterium]MEE1023918.1 sigma-70 family RNA polymerase sigma factor [Acutalibacteraceae bacterium]